MDNYDEEKLELIEVKLDFLIENLLDSVSQEILGNKIRDIKGRYWEERMGEDL